MSPDKDATIAILTKKISELTNLLSLREGETVRVINQAESMERHFNRILRKERKKVKDLQAQIKHKEISELNKSWGQPYAKTSTEPQ